MKRHLAAIHPQGEGTVSYNALVICFHLWNLWVRPHFPSLGVPPEEFRLAARIRRA